MYGSESEDEDDEEYEDFDEAEAAAYSDDEEGSEQSDTSDGASEATAQKPGNNDTPNPKTEQFLDRIQHFFEVRRKVEERADMMDPSNKLRKLRVKFHSGGIKKNGKSYPNISIVGKRRSSSGSTTLTLLPRNTSKTKILRRPRTNYSKCAVASVLSVK
jgi:hypothetical protein